MTNSACSPRRQRPPGVFEWAGVGSAASKHDTSCNTMDTAMAATAGVVCMCTLNAGEGDWERAAASRTAWPRRLITSADCVPRTQFACILERFPENTRSGNCFPGNGKNFRDPGNSGPVNIPNCDYTVGNTLQLQTTSLTTLQSQQSSHSTLPIVLRCTGKQL